MWLSELHVIVSSTLLSSVEYKLFEGCDSFYVALYYAFPVPRILHGMWYYTYSNDLITDFTMSANIY